MRQMILVLALVHGGTPVHAGEVEELEFFALEDDSSIQAEISDVEREVQQVLKDSPAYVADLGKGSLSKAERMVRLEHAQELLGKHYSKSVVRSGERVKKINKMVYRWTRNQLPAKFRKNYKKIAQAIIDESLKHEFDPVFLMAVISNESRFNPRAAGSFGEIGLMQILPNTGKWIAGMIGLKWQGKKTLRDPVSNIRLGAAFLAHLRKEFDSHARLYLAAYNMGQRNVREAMGKKIWPKDYAGAVMRFYVGYYTELRDSEKSNKLARLPAAPIKIAHMD